MAPLAEVVVDGGMDRGEFLQGHVAHLFHEERVGGELEALGAMRLQAEEREVAPPCSWRCRFRRPPSARSSGWRSWAGSDQRRLGSSNRHRHLSLTGNDAVHAGNNYAS